MVMMDVPEPVEGRYDAALLKIAMRLRAKPTPDIDDLVLETAETMELNVEELRRFIAKHVRTLTNTVAEATPNRRSGRL